MNDRPYRLLIRTAQQAAKQGQPQKARQLLLQAAKTNPDDHRLWLWLAGVSASPQESLDFVLRAEALAPDDPTVQQARSWAEKRLPAPLPPRTAHPQPSQSTPKPQPEPSTLSKTAPSQRQPQRAASPVEMEEQRLRAASARKRRRAYRRRRLLVGSALAVVLILALAATAWTWSRWQNSQAAGTETAASAGVTIDEATPATTAAQLETAASSRSAPPPANAAPVITATPTANPIQPKNIISSSDGPHSTWTPTPSPTNTPLPSPTPVPTFVGEVAEDAPLMPQGLTLNDPWIDVDLSEQYLIAYEGLTPVFETLVSTGTWDHPTVTGQFRIYLRYESQTMDGRRLGYDYYLENVQFVQYFFEDYALHGTYWHNNFGTPMSHGCVNLSNSAAEWLFTWAEYGTLINVHN